MISSETQTKPLYSKNIIIGSHEHSNDNNYHKRDNYLFFFSLVITYITLMIDLMVPLIPDAGVVHDIFGCYSVSGIVSTSIGTPRDF